MNYLRIKRLWDLCIAGVGIGVCLPVMLIIACLIKIDSKGPILFKQKRLGKGKKAFSMYKFRTMTIETPTDVPTDQLHDAKDYITRIGKVLRKTSLDELPQLFNILKGDMSFIGPRPSLTNQTELIKLREIVHVYDVAPGLSGLAQIRGRDELSDIEKAQLDGVYVSEIGIRLDSYCFVQTVLKVINGDGIVEGNKNVK